MRTKGQSTIVTYRALRMGVVAAALLLMVSLVGEVIRVHGLVLTSISASFYSPVRNVFVGVLVATGMALIAIMGREKGEDEALNLAGMLAPTIGMLPTTVGPSAPGACREGVSRCIPAATLVDVENNVGSLLVLGLVVLAGALVYVLRTYGGRSLQLRQWALPAGVWIVSAAAWIFARGLVLAHGHNVAAFFFFLLLAYVAHINAQDPPEGPTVKRLTPRGYQRWYRLISAAMTVTIVLTAAYTIAILVRWLPDSYPQWFFVAESVLLVLFVAFWALQTMHFWHEGVPDGLDGDPEDATT
ncbi:MAG TPA: hypothetical protein VFK68_13445 [Propionibacteriaceae bacterium]|nr:hypothetical protein [Propionibacteriaceae bacterium]